MAKLNEFTKVIAAGGHAVVPIGGMRSVRVIAATHHFIIGVDAADGGTGFVGMQFSCTPEETYSNLLLDNTFSGAQLTVTIATSIGSISDSRVQATSDVVDATQLVPGPDVATAGVAAILACAERAARKWVIITALTANANELRVGDATVGVAQGTPLQAGESISLPGTAEVWIIRNGGANVSVAVLEVVE